MADSASQRVRTYHARRGRLSEDQRVALATAGDQLLLAAEGHRLDLREVFGPSSNVVLDIGCGMGDSVIAQASAAASTSVIAIDVHSRGVASLLRRCERQGSTNIRVVHGDAVAFIEHRLPRQSVAGVRIYFPDPWPKVRHHKRRLVQPAFVSLVVDRLVPGGFIHCATDDAGYADQMVAVFDDEPQLSNPFGGFAPRRLGDTLADDVPGVVERPVTKYELRAERLGHQVRDVWVTRRLRP